MRVTPFASARIARCIVRSDSEFMLSRGRYRITLALAALCCFSEFLSNSLVRAFIYTGWIYKAQFHQYKIILNRFNLCFFLYLLLILKVKKK